MQENPAYCEHLLKAPDVCKNCLRKIRVERVDPTRSGLTKEYESHLARHEVYTEVGYGPARSVSEQKGVFCTDCGTESAFDRHWDDVDFHDPAAPLGYDRFRELAKNAMASLEEAGVSIDRHAFATTALSRYDDGHGIDHCLGEATEHAIVSAAMDSANERQPARAD